MLKAGGGGVKKDRLSFMFFIGKEVINRECIFLILLTFALWPNVYQEIPSLVESSYVVYINKLNSSST